MAESKITVTAGGVEFKTKALEIARDIAFEVKGKSGSIDGAKEHARLIYELQHIILHGEEPSSE